jgi:hypothetical protein
MSFWQLAPLDCRGGAFPAGGKQPRVVFLDDGLAPAARLVALKGVARCWWASDDAGRISCCPQDDAGAYDGRVRAEDRKADSLAFQGASRCAISHVRSWSV